MKRRLVTLALVILVATATAGAAPKRPSDPAAVVTALYRYHFAHKLRWDLTLKNNRAAFDPALLALLDEADRKQAATPDEIVGLDFDPIVDAQDTPNGYRVGRTTREGADAIVTVAIRFGTEHYDVRVRLAPSGGTWRITNLLYRQEGDLVSILKEILAPPAPS